MKKFVLIIVFLIGALLLASCQGPAGIQGPPGPQGPQGEQGFQGEAGGGALSEEQTKTLEGAKALVDAVPFPALEEQSRGCTACHVIVDKETGAYTLAYEAEERAKASGGEHPKTAPDGTSLAPTEEVNVQTCLLCHASGTDGKGVGAPLSLRDIVHPAHMGSQYFKLHYGGSCFTCHNVDGEGNWDLLTEKVDVNEKGVPNPDNIPIPGAIDIE